MSNDEGRTSTLNVPTMFTNLRGRQRYAATRDLHQYLNERGKRAVRLHEMVTGKKIWAGASITKRQDGRVFA
jgi:hypothetical protein